MMLQGSYFVLFAIAPWSCIKLARRITMPFPVWHVHGTATLIVIRF
jgi:hypothetical protein